MRDRTKRWLVFYAGNPEPTSSMRFHEGHIPTHDLTYEDVCFVPQYSDVPSRTVVNTDTLDGTGNSIPIIIANMNAVAGARMAETVARRGGLVVLPQDLAPEALVRTIREIKTAHPQYDTPVVVGPYTRLGEAWEAISKRAHGTAIVRTEDGTLLTYTASLHRNSLNPRSRIKSLFENMTETPLYPVDTDPKQIYNELHANDLNLAGITDGDELVGVMTRKGALRAHLYRPNVDKDGRLKVAVALGINGDTVAETERVIEAGADVLVIDTAHGHQEKMLQALRVARKVVGSEVTIIAGNVVTAEATRDLIEAGADIVKVGVGPGAMCTTRMMTGAGRPQFSAVMECAAAADEYERYVLADGGIRHPRDAAFALGAGASNVMIGSLFAGTVEAEAPIQYDDMGRPYKSNHGMASEHAVQARYDVLSPFQQAIKRMYDEGISESKMYIDPKKPGAEDIIDKFMPGIKSAMTYSGARTLAEFHKKAVFAIQSHAGYAEGKPVPTSWH